MLSPLPLTEALMETGSGFPLAQCPRGVLMIGGLSVVISREHGAALTPNCTA